MEEIIAVNEISERRVLSSSMHADYSYDSSSEDESVEAIVVANSQVPIEVYKLCINSHVSVFRRSIYLAPCHV